MFIVHALPSGEPSPADTDRAVVADDRAGSAAASGPWRLFLLYGG